MLIHEFSVLFQLLSTFQSPLVDVDGFTSLRPEVEVNKF